MAKYTVDSNNEFNKAINNAVKKLDDLSIPFTLMTREWYKGNRSIFDESRKSAGKYADLSPRYKAAKTKAIGSPYPILRGFFKPAGQKAKKSGKLADSMIKPDNADAISTIVNKKTLVLGTKVKSKKGAPYPNFLHFGTRKMPARPFALIGGEQVATNQINQRRVAWIRMLGDYAKQVSEGFAK